MTQSNKQHDTAPIRISASGSGKALMTIDMQPYIQAYLDFREKLSRDMSEDEIRDIRRDYDQAKKKFNDPVIGVNGQYLWVEFFKEATQGFSPERIKEIENSPAVMYMQVNFVEIVKNCMDEAILNYDPHTYRPMRLEVTLDDETDPNHITLMLADTGRGFPDSFLDQTSSVSSKEAYIQKVGSKKLDAKKDVFDMQGNDKNNELCMFGGAGRGLRMLMTNVMYGDELHESGVRQPKYIKPEISEISFSNKVVGSGAVISITTSKNPLILVHENQLPIISDEMGPTLTLPCKKRKLHHEMKKQVDELRKSPDTVVELGNTPLINPHIKTIN